MESLRGNIRLDELQMSFGKDKYQVSENLVSLKLDRGDQRHAFDFVEQSKSAHLIDLLERNLETVWDASADESPRLLRIRKIREELNVLYSRLNQVGDVCRRQCRNGQYRDQGRDFPARTRTGGIVARAWLREVGLGHIAKHETCLR